MPRSLNVALIKWYPIKSSKNTQIWHPCTRQKYTAMWRLRTYDFLHLIALPKGSYLKIRYDHYYFILITPFAKFLSMAQPPVVVQGLIIFQASLSHSVTLHSLWLHWTSDQSDTETSTWQHTTLTGERDIDAPGGTLNRSPGKGVAENPHLRKLGHWYQLIHKYSNVHKRHRIY